MLYFNDQKLQFTFPLYFLWVSFALWIRNHIPYPDPDTDPLTWLNPDPIWIRIRNTSHQSKFYFIMSC
jgi:hypothetical protein